MNSPLAALLSLLLISGAGWAHDGHQHDEHTSGQADAAAEAVDGAIADARSWFTDTRLVNQDGQSMRFFSDVLQGRVVLLNVMFTSCSDACPLITRHLQDVREAMGDSAREVHFVSLTSDPLRDTPDVLKAFAAKHGVDTRYWTFLTGEPADMDLVLARLGHRIPSPELHSTELIAGDVPNKRWSRIQPNAPIPAIAARLQLLLRPVAAR